MTRKDYELIAGAIDRSRAAIIANTRHCPTDRYQRLKATELVTTSLAHSLEGTNPRFDTSRFYAAATEGPLYLAALNDEALARELGPSKREPTRLKFAFEHP